MHCSVCEGESESESVHVQFWFNWMQATSFSLKRESGIPITAIPEIPECFNITLSTYILTKKNNNNNKLVRCIYI